MAYWNHRVLQRHDPIEGETYVIHEVYYNENDEITMWTENPVTVEAESVESLRFTLANMLGALNKPALREVHLDGKARLIPSTRETSKRE